MDTKKEIICPACGNKLAKTEIEGKMIDVCQDGCGGIWFDHYEIRLFDEKFEEAGEILAQVRRKPGIKVDHTQRRKCPVCPDSVLMRHFYSPRREVEVDECPTCGGMWLDTGELAHIREQFENNEERKKFVQNFCAKNSANFMRAQNELLEANVCDEEELELLADNDLTEEQKQVLIQNEEELKIQQLRNKATKFAKMFPFLYISWYIPGKQKGMTY